MTVEHNVVVGLRDINAIILECKNSKCRKRIQYQPDAVIDIPELCTCGNRWSVPTVISTRQTDSPLLNFVNLLVAIRGLAENQEIGFKILLQFAEPSTVTLSASQKSAGQQ
jgi:hypothetical protein